MSGAASCYPSVARPPTNRTRTRGVPVTAPRERGDLTLQRRHTSLPVHPASPYLPTPLSLFFAMRYLPFVAHITFSTCHELYLYFQFFLFIIPLFLISRLVIFPVRARGSFVLEIICFSYSQILTVSCRVHLRPSCLVSSSKSHGFIA